MLSELYRIEGDYQSAIKGTEVGLDLARKAESSYGLTLSKYVSNSSQSSHL